MLTFMQKPNPISPLSLLAGAVALLGLAQATAGPARSSLPPRAAAAWAALPLAFEPLPDQPEAPARFLARGHNYHFTIAPTQAQLTLWKVVSPPSSPLDRVPSVSARVAQARTLRLDFLGANPQARLAGLDALPGKVNYLIGNDPARWRTGVGTYRQVRVAAVYPGIDLVYYGNQDRLEYDLVVAPGAEPGSIAVHFEGADRVTLNADGELVLGLGADEVRQPRPALYQNVGGQRRAVAGGYRLKDARTVTFTAGQYDRSLPLVIDPTLLYSTYFGGNGDDIIWAVKVYPPDGSIYLAGQTTSSQFPFVVPTGGYQSTNAGGNITGDAFIARLDASGTNLLFFTFLGGTGDNSALDLALDAEGHAYVTGFTDSTNFPAGPVAGLPNATHISGTLTPAGVYFLDAFVAELTSDGAGLLFSAYLGGSDLDAGIGIALDASNFVYVTGYTYSTNFPTANPLVVKPLGSSAVLTLDTVQGSNDVFVTKFSPGGASLVYSTYLGGGNYDVGQGIAADDQGNAYVTGYTASTNFPVTAVLTDLTGQLDNSTNAVASYNGRIVPPYDAFVAKIAPLGSNLLYCAYLGGANNDSGYRIRLDGAGAVYVTGASSSPDFPSLPQVITNLIPRGLTNASYLNDDIFLTKLTAHDNVPTIECSFLFGGTGNDTGWDLAVAPVTTNIFLTGSTTSTNFPFYPLSATNAPFLQATNQVRSNDVFVASFAPTILISTNFIITNILVNGHLQPVLFPVPVTNHVLTNVYALTLGGTRDEFGLGIDVDAAGNAYVVGQTESGDFPVLNALQPVLAGRSDGFLAKIQYDDALTAVTVDTVPPHLLVIVDGSTNVAPFITNWAYGSGHIIGAVPVQAGAPGTQFVWTGWNQNGFLSQQVMPEGPATNYIASFQTQYFLTTAAVGGGVVNPPSGWQNAGAIVRITATPASGATFAGWAGSGTGSLSGTANPISLTMGGPITETASFTGTPGNRLTVVVNGAGTVSPNYNGQALQVGRSHVVTAQPNPGNVFTSWTGSLITTNPALSFVMSNGLVLVANFTTNVFAAAQGNYVGLFFDTNHPVPISAGAFSATVSPNGAFSASLQVAGQPPGFGGQSYALAGQFNNGGTFTGSIPLGGTLSPVLVRLQLDLNGGNRLTGAVSQNFWLAQLLAERSVYGPANLAPERGRTYNLRVVGSPNSLAAPGGDSFGTVTVSPAGQVTFTGTLSDNSPVTQTTFVSGDGLWPLYVRLYGGRGAILGWLSFAGSGASQIAGAVSWFKAPLPVPRQMYPGGFAFDTEAVGGAYTFTNGQRVLGLSQARVVVQNAGLLENYESGFTNLVSVTANNQVVNLTRSEPLSLTVNPAVGSFAGSFRHPVTGQAVPFRGSLLPFLTNGTGFFLTTNQSGRVYFGP